MNETTLAIYSVMFSEDPDSTVTCAAIDNTGAIRGESKVKSLDFAGSLDLGLGPEFRDRIFATGKIT